MNNWKKCSKLFSTSCESQGRRFKNHFTLFLGVFTHTHTNKQCILSGWWFQSIWQILVKLDHSPQVEGLKLTIFETTTQKNSRRRIHNHNADPPKNGRPGAASGEPKSRLGCLRDTTDEKKNSAAGWLMLPETHLKDIWIRSNWMVYINLPPKWK